MVCHFLLVPVTFVHSRDCLSFSSLGIIRLLNVKWHVSVIFIFIFLFTSEDKHLFICSLTIYVSSLVNCCSNFLTTFLFGYLFFFPYCSKFRYHPLSVLCFAKQLCKFYAYSICGLSLHFLLPIALFKILKKSIF